MVGAVVRTCGSQRGARTHARGISHLGICELHHFDIGLLALAYEVYSPIFLFIPYTIPFR